MNMICLLLFIRFVKNTPLTPLRNEIYDIFQEYNHPLKAYKVLGILAARGRDIKPISVYRVLNYLVSKNFLHKIESEKVFMLCQQEGCSSQHNIFLTCKNCALITECSDDEIIAPLFLFCKKNNFYLLDEKIELSGLCKKCKSAK